MSQLIEANIRSAIEKIVEIKLEANNKTENRSQFA
jgi:hypothetical protein